MRNGRMGTEDQQFDEGESVRPKEATAAETVELGTVCLFSTRESKANEARRLFDVVLAEVSGFADFRSLWPISTKGIQLARAARNRQAIAMACGIPR